MTLAGHHVDAVMFDLDGTLIDSRPGIESSVRAALADLRLDPAGPWRDSWLGAPLAGLIEAVMPGSTMSERELAVRAFKRHYDDSGWRASAPYAGARPLLERLRQSGIRLFVVTNKRRHPTLAILEHHGLVDCLEAIYTPDSRVPRYTSKGEMGQACIEEHGLDPSSTLVVGDSRDDLEMARRCGTVFGAASWGYGSVVAADPPDVFLVALTDLEVLILEQAGGTSTR